MKLSEAIKIGMQGKKQCRGRYFDSYLSDVTKIKECCALGAAYIGWSQFTGNPFFPFAMRPLSHCFDLQGHNSVGGMIMEWNDNLRMRKTSAGIWEVEREFSSHKPIYVLRKKITYILTGGQFGIEPGYVVMGLEDEK